MFKKTLLALALTGLAGTATAGTIITAGNITDGKIGTNTDGAYSISTEGSVGFDAVTVDNVRFEINNTKSEQYRTFETFIVDISGATLSPATNAELSVVGVTPVSGLFEFGAVGQEDTLKVTSVEYPSASQVKFTVEYVDGGVDSTVPQTPVGELGLPANTTFEIDGLNLTFASKEAGSSISYSVVAQSAVGNTEIDKASGVVAEFASELSASVSSTVNFKETINVAAARKMFVGDTEAEMLGTSVKVDVVTKEADLLPATQVSAPEITYTLNGDFSFLDTDSDGEIDKEFDLTGTVAEDLQSTVLTSTNKTATFNFETDGSVVLPESDFTVDVAFDYKTAAAQAKAAEFDSSYAAGSWRLNGSGGFINFMPFGSQYAQSITVTNTGTVEAPISVTLTYAGESYSTTLDTVAAAKSITDISKKVAAFAAENGVVGNATVSINVASPTTSVDAIYYAKKDADRVKVK